MNHLENTRIARRYMATVPEKNISVGLHQWRKFETGPHTCGTIACFGGWLPAMPEFAAMGVIATFGGAPMLKEYGHYFPTEVAEHLFGKEGSDLFDMVGDCAYDKDFYGTAHSIVMHRLDKHIEYLKGLK